MMKKIIMILILIICALQVKIINAKTVDNYNYSMHGGDVLLITVYDNPDLSSDMNNYIVRPDGRISIPLIGEVNVLGKSIATFNMEITNKLKEYIINPIVTTSVVVPGKVKVYVLGEIKKQGIVHLSKSFKLLDAISAANGFTELTSKKRVALIRRGNQEPIVTINLNELLKNGTESQNILLEEGDCLYFTSNNKLMFKDDVLPYLQGIKQYQKIENID